MIRLLATFTLAFASVAAPFQNGDFETGYTEVTTVSPGDSRIAGWRIGGGSIVWDGSIHFPNPAPVQEWIQQTFDTIPGHNYRLVFGFWHQGDGGSDAAVRVDISSSTGNSLVSKTNFMGNITGTVGFSDVTHESTATTATTTLRITHAFAADVTIREARIDNIRVNDLSVPATLSTRLFPGIFIEGQVGLTYQLEYADQDRPSTWSAAGTFTLDTSPKLVLVQTNVVPQRIFRAILVP
jgi:hypothetical protein